MVSIQTQTQQFLMLLDYEDKLTKLYQRIKVAQTEKQELTDKVEFLEFKNKALQTSLFQQQYKTRVRQSSLNETLLHDVINLEEELVKCKNQQRNTEVKHKNNNDASVNSNCMDMANKTRQRSESTNSKLGTIKQQPEIQNLSNLQMMLTMPNKNTNSAYSSVPRAAKSKKQSEIQSLSEKLSQMQKQLEKNEKNRKIMDVETKRLRKMNEQLNSKCKRLERLLEAKEQLFMNLSSKMNSNGFSNTTNPQSSYLHRSGDQDSLFE